MRRVPVLIVGQGFAGTALAWRLHFAGRPFLMVDAEAAAGASRVAAGLVTPVTGRRLVKAGDFDPLLAEATAFYRQVEAALGAAVFHPRPALRLFQTDDERRTFAAKRETEFAGSVDPHPVIPPDLVAPFGGFAMTAAARLDAPAYLAGSRAYFATRGMSEAASLTLPDDLEVSSDAVTVAKLGIEAERVVFCQGYAANPWFDRVPFQPAQGDVLTLRIAGYDEPRVVHRGVWLAPVGGERFLCGATYSWEPFDGLPRAAGRAELERKLCEFLCLPFEVVDHRAAVRPVLRDGRPRVGTHPAFPRLAFFNGLGSKGALVAPHFAGRLARHLLHGDPLDPSADVRGVL